MINDYYLNLLAWSSANVVGVALREAVYIWNAGTNSTELLSSCEEEGENAYVSSVDFSADGSFAGVGLDGGNTEIWDVETRTRLRSMASVSPSSSSSSSNAAAGQISSLSWSPTHLISTGSASGLITHHDVRIAQSAVQTLSGHTGEVCGLRWRGDGEVLASGGNDNVVNCWDARLGGVGGEGGANGGEGAGRRGRALWSSTSHTAAVKVRRHFISTFFHRFLTMVDFTT